MKDQHWERVARSSAAREWGRRHHRWYAMSYYRQGCATIAIITGILGALGGIGWWLWMLRVPTPVLLLVVATAATIAGGMRLAVLLTRPASRWSRGGSGGLGWILAVIVICIVLAVATSCG